MAYEQPNELEEEFNAPTFFRREIWTCLIVLFFFFCAANLIALTQGLQVGWVSTTLPSLASNDTPLLSGPITNDQLSWVGSINCIGALIGSFSVGYLTNLLGSKRTVHFLAVPYAISWLLIYFGNTYQHILLARFVWKFHRFSRTVDFDHLVIFFSFKGLSVEWLVQVLYLFYHMFGKSFRFLGLIYCPTLSPICRCWKHCSLVCHGNSERWVRVFNWKFKLSVEKLIFFEFLQHPRSAL